MRCTMILQQLHHVRRFFLSTLPCSQEPTARPTHLCLQLSLVIAKVVHGLGDTRDGLLQLAPLPVLMCELIQPQQHL